MTQRRALYNFETLLQCDLFDLREENDGVWLIEREVSEDETTAEYAKSDCLIVIVGLEWHTHLSSTINSFTRVIWEWIRERPEVKYHAKTLGVSWTEQDSTEKVPLIVLYDVMRDEFVVKYREELDATEENTSNGNGVSASNGNERSRTTPARLTEHLAKSSHKLPTVTLTNEYSVEQAKRDHELLSLQNDDLKHTIHTLRDQISLLQSQLQLERNEHTISANQLKDVEDKLIHQHVNQEDIQRMRVELEEAHEQSLFNIKKRLATHLHNYYVSKSRTLRSNFEQRAQFFHDHITEKDLKKIELRYKEHMRMLLSRYAACMEILTAKQIPPINVTGHIGFAKKDELQQEIVQGAQFESKLLNSVENFTGPLEDIIIPNLSSSRLKVIREDIERHKRRLSIGSVGSATSPSPGTPTSKRPSRANSLKISTVRQFNGADSDVDSVSSSPRSTSPSSKMLATPGSPTLSHSIVQKFALNGAVSGQKESFKVQDLERKLDQKDETIAALSETVAWQQKQIMSLMQQLEERR